MTVAVGTKLVRYEIRSKLSESGMGEVPAPGVSARTTTSDNG